MAGFDNLRALAALLTGAGHVPAVDVDYDNIASGLTAIEVQGAIDELAGMVGGGAVDSVNAQTGVVVLDAGDVGADVAGAAAAAQAAAIAASQPLDADLTAIAALTTTSYGRAFLALADAAAGRTALALGTAATSATGDFDAAGAAATAQAAAIAAAASDATTKANAAQAAAIRASSTWGSKW